MQVSYIKAVDWYLIVSFLFVFAVLIEYTLVLYLTDKEKQADVKKLEKMRTVGLRRENNNIQVILVLSYYITYIKMISRSFSFEKSY